MFKSEFKNYECNKTSDICALEDQFEGIMIKCERKHHATKRVVLMQKSLACDENHMVASHIV
jgi:hypothetical protein